MSVVDIKSAELKIALEAANAAAAISRSYYRGDISISIKQDLTPVTQADVECEQVIRKIIPGAFPDHGFYGEETGKTQASADNLWLVDPIDGTEAFVRQYPIFFHTDCTDQSWRAGARRIMWHDV
jgi:histidinol-phosphatase